MTEKTIHDNNTMYYGLIFLGLFFHIIFEGVFLYSRSITMIYYNLISIAVFSYALINLKKNQSKMVFISFLEAMIFCIVATASMGWDYNFQAWLIAFAVLSLTVPFPNRRHFYILALIMAASYFVLYFAVKMDFNTNRVNFLDMFFAILNILGVFTMIFFAERVLRWSDIMQNFFLQNEVDKMKSIVGTDELTGLVNRHKMNIILEDMNKMLRFNPTDIFYISFADIDDFKYINDTYGHDIGDRVLKFIAKILNREFRNEDIVARWGGEEFVILLRNIKGRDESLDDDKVFTILNRVRTKIEKVNIEYKGEKIYITMTFGAVSSKGYTDVSHMINSADEKMYKGKNSGKNKVVL